MNLPRLTQEDSRLIVELRIAPAARVVLTEFVVDLDDAGKPLALEILFLQHHAGPRVLDGLSEVIQGSGLEYSFDPENDAFYLVMEKGLSANQRAVEGRIVLNAAGEVVRLEAPLRRLPGSDHN